MDEIIVAAAAIVHRDRLLVAKRHNPPALAGYWELPGDEVRDGESEPDALRREFNDEFNVAIECFDRILSDQRLVWWRDEDDEPVDAVLRLWRCRLPTGRTYDVDAGEPQPLLNEYDSSAWLPMGDFDAVGPWRDGDRMLLDELASWYRADTSWPTSD